MESMRQRDTAAEMKIRRVLHAKGYRYRVDYKIFPKLRRKADIVFIRQKLAIFIDGCFWHGCPKHGTWPRQNAEFWRNKIKTNQARDRETDQKLIDAGWKVVRVWEHEDPVQVADKIICVLKN